MTDKYPSLDRTSKNRFIQHVQAVANGESDHIEISDEHFDRWHSTAIDFMLDTLKEYGPLPHLKNLYILDCADSPNIYIPFIIKAAEFAPNLEVLNTNYITFSQEDLEQLKDALPLPHLKELHFGNYTVVNRTTMNSLVPFIDRLTQNCQGLEKISLLSHKAVDDEEIQALQPIFSRHPLKEVSIFGREVTAEGVRILVEALRQQGTLETLSIGGAGIGEGSDAQLAEALRALPRLRSLNIDYANPATLAEFTAVLSEAPHLTNLSLDNVDIPIEQYKALLQKGMGEAQLVHLKLHPSANRHLLYEDIPWVQNPNLLKLNLSGSYPILQGIENNQKAAREACITLTEHHGDLTALSGPEIHAIHHRENAVFYYTFIDNEGQITSKEAKAEFDALIATLPGKPQDADGLFAADDRHFSPLDNPTLWPDAASMRADMEQWQVKPEQFKRATAKGITLIDWAYALMPTREATEFLNTHNVSSAPRLLDEKGQPTLLFKDALIKDEAAEFFTRANFSGHADILPAAYDFLSEWEQKKISFHTLRQAVSSVIASGRSR